MTGLTAPYGRLLGNEAALTGGTATPGFTLLIGLKATEARGGLIAPPVADWIPLEVGGKTAGATVRAAASEGINILGTGARPCVDIAAGGAGKGGGDNKLGLGCNSGAFV